LRKRQFEVRNSQALRKPQSRKTDGESLQINNSEKELRTEFCQPHRRATSLTQSHA
jgi:hypothetical protein